MPGPKKPKPKTLADLRAMKRWVCWDRVPPEKEGGKPGKPPLNARTGRPASSTNPDDWSTHAEAVEAQKANGWAGIGFAMKAEDGLVFIDLDDCRNQKNKAIHAWAEPILKRLNSFTEVSQSGTGVHVFVRATKPGVLCKKGKVEMYDDARFAYMTDRPMMRFPEAFEERQEAVEWVYREAISQIGGDRSVPAVPVPVPKEKLDLLLKDRKAASIYRGEQNGQYPSQSEADLALATIAVRKQFTEGECRSVIETARTNAKAAPKHDAYFTLTWGKARGDYEPVTLPAARVVFARHLALPDATILDVVLATVASSHLPGDPLWLHVVGPPSSGKTEHIAVVDGWPAVYPLSELTPAGLVSGRNSDDGQDHSLMPLLNGRTLAIKDFTPTIDAPKEQRDRLFGRLRDAFDGKQSVHTAMVGTRRHEATFNCITGVTNAIEKVWRNTSLGERYLLYRHLPGDPREAAMRALRGAPVKVKLRDDLRRAACGVLAGVDQDSVPTCSEGMRGEITRLAMMVALARTYVERDRDHKVEYLPEPEGPARVVQQLFKLGQGLALINGRREIDADDLKILRRVAVDSIPSKRRKFIEVLTSKDDPTSAEFEQATGLGQSAVHEGLDDLRLLKIAEKELVRNTMLDPGTNHYRLTEEFRALADGLDFRPTGTVKGNGTAERNGRGRNAK